MNFLFKEKRDLASVIHGNRPVGRMERLRLAVSLSIPAIVAQISAIVMQYIDASMVGSLGALPAASIGLVTTSTWIFFGLCSACSVGFSVQVAHLLGAGNGKGAREVLRQSLVAALLYSLVLSAIGVSISFDLPRWLGGEPEIRPNASLYFLITVAAMPLFQFSYLSSGMLRSSGNMVFPGMVGTLMCILDVIFNFFLIFPTREVNFLGFSLNFPGFGCGVWGAALGTSLAEGVGALIMLWKIIFSSKELRIIEERGSFRLRKSCMKKAFHIGFPLGIERFLTSGAQVMITIIVAPLGAASIAANAFAVIAESICYMPGYGIGDATTTLVGQSIGAGKLTLTRQFAYTSTALGMIVMTALGVVMYLVAPLMMEIMSPDKEIVDLGVVALRTEAWAEPMYAASIVAYGAFVGAGDTLIPCFMNLGCMWGVRVILAAVLAPVLGLHGVWIAMAIELTFRGIVFLIRLRGKKWMLRINKLNSIN
ncbi:MAG: MATE family efflux transporter [Muribaculaceae bacterium]|nr:MATE family efflux transporter [Muribaculaceae bacterium]